VRARVGTVAGARAGGRVRAGAGIEKGA